MVDIVFVGIEAFILYIEQIVFVLAKYNLSKNNKTEAVKLYIGTNLQNEH